MSGSSSRKPSGSSTHSRAHSPLGSSPNAHRNPNSSDVYTNGLKSLHSGWQVWGSATLTSKNIVPTGAHGAELGEAENNFRVSVGDGWTPSLNSSTAWDEELQQRKDFAPEGPSLSTAPHHARSMTVQTAVTPTALAVPRMDDRAVGVKTFLRGHEDGSRFPLTPSPTRLNFPASYVDPQSHVSNGLVHPINGTTNEASQLAFALRGMVIGEDDNVVQSVASAVQCHRGPTPLPQPRPYGLYAHPEYNGYYLHPSREPYSEYPYGYAPSDPSLYGSPVMGPAPLTGLYQNVGPLIPHPGLVPDVNCQPGMYHELGRTRQTSQFYYPTHQPVLYSHPHSPMITPQIPGVLIDKKLEMQSQGLHYGAMRSTPPLHPQFFPIADYASTLPVMMSGPLGIYGLGQLQVFRSNVRPSRRHASDIHESATLRSPLLDEFRGSKVRKWELRDIFGYIVEFSGDQHGSRFIQQKLETSTSDEKQRVFDEIVPSSTLQLIQDVFGNYVIQKLFEHGTQVQKTLLTNTMEGHVYTLSVQMYGCRVIQKAIEYVLPEQQNMIVRELEPHVLRCVKDSNGNHVIQKLIERVSANRLNFIHTFVGNVFELSTHPYGCRVLQRCLEHLPEEYLRPLLDELHNYTISLMQDQFGNYVIQYVLEHGRPQDCAFVTEKLRGQVLQMAKHKFASNVCEKALLCAEPEGRRVLIDEIITSNSSGISPVTSMMKDQYGNYVLQRALVVAESDQREVLIDRIKPQLANLRRYSSAYTKHLASIERVIDKYSPKKCDSALPQLTVIPPDDL